MNPHFNSPLRVLVLACAAGSTAAPAALAQSGGPYTLTWSTFDGGGGTSSGGAYAVSGTAGQPDAGFHAGGADTLTGGFWSCVAGLPCYANCDQSTTPPILNVNDFVCFSQRFAAANPYADCDASGTLNVNDFVCFQQRFAAGCP